MGSEDKEQLMTNDDRWTVEALLGAFDEDLRRTRGVCEGTRGNYTGHVRAFLATVSAAGTVRARKKLGSRCPRLLGEVGIRVRGPSTP
jgi:hypothetical protein